MARRQQSLEQLACIDAIAKHRACRGRVGREFLAHMALQANPRYAAADRRPPAHRQRRCHHEIEDGQQAFPKVLVGKAAKPAGVNQLAAEEADVLRPFRDEDVGDDFSTETGCRWQLAGGLAGFCEPPQPHRSSPFFDPRFTASAWDVQGHVRAQDFCKFRLPYIWARRVAYVIGIRHKGIISSFVQRELAPATPDR